MDKSAQYGPQPMMSSGLWVHLGAVVGRSYGGAPRPEEATIPIRQLADKSFATVVVLDQPSTGGITLRTNAGAVAVGQSLKTYTGTIVLSTTGAVVQPLETVTAGKTFYITDINISSNNANQFLVQIQANGVDIFDSFVKGDTAPCTMAGLESQPNATSGVAVTLRIGSVATATTASFFIAGFEQ